MTDRGPITHALKSWPMFFEDLVAGAKTFEIRDDDRPFQVGDLLLLQEWNPKTKTYTGRQTQRTITHIMRPSRATRGLETGYCILSLR
jgi:hypothetical protein